MRKINKATLERLERLEAERASVVSGCGLYMSPPMTYSQWALTTLATQTALKNSVEKDKHHAPLDTSGFMDLDSQAYTDALLALPDETPEQSEAILDAHGYYGTTVAT